jgi:hypothetical protein
MARNTNDKLILKGKELSYEAEKIFRITACISGWINHGGFPGICGY